jgi:lysyl-tRNA synthetase class II
MPGPPCPTSSASSYHSTRILAEDSKPAPTHNRFTAMLEDGEDMSSFKKQRLEDLQQASSAGIEADPEAEAEEPLLEDAYPRLQDAKFQRVSVPDFLSDFHKGLPLKEYNLMGRVRGKRIQGKGLIFLDIVNEFQQVQVMVSRKFVLSRSPKFRNRFKMFRHLIQVGDHICKSTGT